jgi:Ca-activated chloride channel family protein
MEDIKMMKKTTGIKQKVILTILLILVMSPAAAYANGLLIPTKAGVPPLSIKYQSVDIDIMTNAAKTKVVQEFFNNTDHRLEANYVFPLPEEASISDFAMYINGKRMSGELVEKNEARAIYESIVRKMKDPGLLEYMGNNLFRARVFPIEPHSTQKIELEYSQILSYDNNIYSYVYPLKTGMKAARTLEDFTVSVDLKSKAPIKNIYSPTHEIGISRKDDYHAVIGFERMGAYLDKDFKLFYTVSEEDIGLNLFTYNKKGEDGYFMLMAAPKTDLKKGEVSRKDIVFTIDTSGSMAGQKIRDAVDALVFGINNLNEQDRFNIIRFSTDVDIFKDGLVDANKENIAAAVSYAKNMRANGGTAIDYALTESLRLFDSPKGTNILVFLTDGLPTVGTRDIKAIIGNAASKNVNMSRIFTFGVGHDVNTVLLDAISKDGRGMSEYLKTGNEEIEIKLSDFFRKVSNPVLSDISLDFDVVTISKSYPKETPDIFKGDDLVILGRYKGDGAVAIRLKGTINNKKREYVYEGTFTKDNTDHDFIPRLWAVRRVGYLLEEIKLHGEEKELKDEVITLSKQYGIMTPYTSYLVLENEQQYLKYGIKRQRVTRKDAPAKKPAPHTFGGSYKMMAPTPEAPASLSREKTIPAYDALGTEYEQDASVPLEVFSPQDLKEESGRGAVRMSRDIRKMKEGKVADDDNIALSTKVIKGRTFNFTDGWWTESKAKEDMKTLKIKYLSDAYFNIIKAFPEMKEALALGEKIKLVINGKLLVIGEDGEEKMEAEEIKEFFK